MTIRELMDILTGMDPEAEAFVQLFKTDGTSESFEIEAVRDNNGNAQLDIYEETPGS